MTQKLKEAIDVLSSMRDLPVEKQRSLAAGILELVALAKKELTEVTGNNIREDQSIWEVINDLGQGIPEEELPHLPEDGAAEHDHYIYGTPKRYV